jgi:hypothetical protein
MAPRKGTTAPTMPHPRLRASPHQYTIEGPATMPQGSGQWSFNRCLPTATKEGSLMPTQAWRTLLTVARGRSELWLLRFGHERGGGDGEREGEQGRQEPHRCQPNKASGLCQSHVTWEGYWGGGGARVSFRLSQPTDVVVCWWRCPWSCKGN